MCRVRNTAFLSAIEPLFLALSAHSVYTVVIVPLFVTCDCVTTFFVSSLNLAKSPFLLRERSDVTQVTCFWITLSLIGEIRGAKRNYF